MRGGARPWWGSRGLPSKMDGLQWCKSGWASRERPASRALSLCPSLPRGWLRHVPPLVWKLPLAEPPLRVAAPSSLSQRPGHRAMRSQT